MKGNLQRFCVLMIDSIFLFSLELFHKKAWEEGLELHEWIWLEIERCYSKLLKYLHWPILWSILVWWLWVFFSACPGKLAFSARWRFRSSWLDGDGIMNCPMKRTIFGEQKAWFFEHPWRVGGYFWIYVKKGPFIWTKYTDQNQNSESLQSDVIVITLITLVK